jgi:hypothetical protein
VSQDPRLSDLLQYATSVLGVGPADPTAALAQRVENLERRLAAVERTPAVQTGAGSPAGLLARDGTPYGRTTAEFWMKFPTGWRGVSLPLT